MRDLLQTAVHTVAGAFSWGNHWFCFLDPYGSGGQKFPPLGGGGGIGYEANPGVPPATMSGSMMGSDMVMYPVGHSIKETLHFTT